ncbi:MAG: hypothetical protein JWM74_2033 [Myxococcaceae bacterium]|jgi:hypothetical protein|nr:hypothetical protein [Myxococcaceae bacterium]
MEQASARPLHSRVHAMTDPDKSFRRELWKRFRKARTLIESPERWSTSWYAADAHGRWRPAECEDAVRFSLIGALIRAGARPRDVMDAARVHLDSGAADLYERLASADAELSHAESLEVLDILIAALEERQSVGKMQAASKVTSSSPKLPASSPKMPASSPKMPSSSPELPRLS